MALVAVSAQLRAPLWSTRRCMDVNGKQETANTVLIKVCIDDYLVLQLCTSGGILAQDQRAIRVCPTKSSAKDVC